MLKWIFLGLFVAMIVLAISTIMIQKAFREKNKQYALKQSSTEKTGFQVAREILNKNGLSNVNVVIGQEGRDHFDPRNNSISLSPSTYNSSSVSAMAIAAHECGHAIQWSRRTVLVRVREKIQKPVMIASQIGQGLFSFGLLFLFLITGLQSIFLIFIIGGLVLYASMGLFQLVSLPLEFDASRKAKKELAELNMLRSENDVIGTKGVLRAAAMTYVVQFLTTVVFLAILIVKLLMIFRNN